MRHGPVLTGGGTHGGPGVMVTREGARPAAFATARRLGSAASGQPFAQPEPYRRPLRVDDRVDDHVADRAVLPEVLVAQDAVLLGAERLDGAAGPAVVPVGPELHRDAVEVLERPGEQEQLGLGVDRAFRWALTASQVDPISSRRLSGRTFMYVVIPTARPVRASRTVHGTIVPASCSARRRRISAAMPSGDGIRVTQSRHSSPSSTASASSASCSGARSSSTTWSPRSTGASRKAEVTIRP